MSGSGAKPCSESRGTILARSMLDWADFPIARLSGIFDVDRRRRKSGR